MKSYLVYFADRTARLYITDSFLQLSSVLDGLDVTRVEFFPYDVVKLSKNN